MEARGVLLDIDGVIVVSWEPVPGAVAAIDRLRRSELPIRFVTNTTSRSAPQIAQALRHVGVAISDNELITAGVATAELLRREHPGARCLVLNDGSMDDLADMEVVDPGGSVQPDVVVVGSGGPTFGWEELNAALRAVLDGAALVAMHGSSLWTTSDGACLDGGAYVDMLARAAGIEPTVVGKPAAAMFLAGCASLGCEPTDVVMVGDDLHTDVQAAQEAGLTGVLVRTGKYRPALLDGLAVEPDAVIDSLADLPRLLGRA